MAVDLDARWCGSAAAPSPRGSPVSLDGATGELFTGAFATSTPAAATGALAALLEVATAAAGCEVLGRITLPADVGPALEAGATGLVTAVDDVLAATGHLDAWWRRCWPAGEPRPSPASPPSSPAEFIPLLAAAGDAEVGVRAIDLLADESRELLQQTALTTRYPELSVPLGCPRSSRRSSTGSAGPCGIPGERRACTSRAPRQRPRRGGCAARAGPGRRQARRWART
jgi:pyruvate,orthophosphate dikinase